MRTTWFFLLCCCWLASSNAFQRVPPLFTHRRTKHQQHQAAPDPALLLPAILGTTGLVFFLFNGIDVNSKVDLTDTTHFDPPPSYLHTYNQSILHAFHNYIVYPFILYQFVKPDLPPLITTSVRSLGASEYLETKPY